jgi:hypothetical protein
MRLRQRLTDGDPSTTAFAPRKPPDQPLLSATWSSRSGTSKVVGFGREKRASFGRDLTLFVQTVAEVGWAGLTNGDLIAVADRPGSR